jgi:hypothetical protein
MREVERARRRNEEENAQAFRLCFQVTVALLFYSAVTAYFIHRIGSTSP